MSILLISIFLTLFLSSPSPAQAQIPLLHQLAAAYQPSRSTKSLPPQNTIPTNTPPLANTTPAPSDLPATTPTAEGQILGTTNQNSPTAAGTPLESAGRASEPTPLPKNIGGNGKIITVALLGDSMIDTIDSQIMKKSLQKYYPQHQFNILNYGLGASHIEYGLYRLKNDYSYQDKHYPSLISQKPDIIVIESFAYNNFGNNQAGIDRQWLALGAITTEIKQNLPDTKIILAATIAPHSVTFANGSHFDFTALEKIEKTTTIKLYLQNLVNFATSQNFTLANAYTPSLINNQANSSLISLSDHLHPSPLGAEFFSDTISSTIFQHKIL